MSVCGGFDDNHEKRSENNRSLGYVLTRDLPKGFGHNRFSTVSYVLGHSMSSSTGPCNVNKHDNKTPISRNSLVWDKTMAN
jgi:hypothetical protein